MALWPPWFLRASWQIAEAFRSHLSHVSTTGSAAGFNVKVVMAPRKAMGCVSAVATDPHVTCPQVKTQDFTVGNKTDFAMRPSHHRKPIFPLAEQASC